MAPGALAPGRTVRVGVLLRPVLPRGALHRLAFFEMDGSQGSRSNGRVGGEGEKTNGTRRKTPGIKVASEASNVL